MITSAALRFPDGHIETAKRHAFIMQKAAKRNDHTVKKAEQGFLNSDGMFLNRKQAMLHAIEAGQMPEMTRREELYSEDIWLPGTLTEEEKRI